MKYALLGLGLFSLCFFCEAQTERDRVHLVRFQPFQLFVREFSLEYELPLGTKISLGIGAAYRVSQTGEGLGLFRNVYSELFSYEYLQAVNPIYSGYKFNLTPRLYLDEEHSWYLASEFFYRNWSKGRGQAEFLGTEISDGGYTYSGDRKENIDVIGLKVLFGFSYFFMDIGNRTEANVTIFTGIGLRSKTYTYETWDGRVNEKEVDYLKETGSKRMISVHLGVLLGIGFSGNQN